MNECENQSLYEERNNRLKKYYKNRTHLFRYSIAGLGFFGQLATIMAMDRAQPKDPTPAVRAEIQAVREEIKRREELADIRAIKRIFVDVSLPIIDPETEALLTAISQHDMPTVERVLANPSFDINATGSSGSSPLTRAIATRNSGLFDRFLALGASATRPDKTGITPLMAAITWGFEHAIRRLIALSSTDDLNREDVYGNTALVYAATEGQEETVLILLASGACCEDVNHHHQILRRAYDGAHKEGYLEIKSMLLQAGIFISCVRKGRIDYITRILDGDVTVFADRRFFLNNPLFLCLRDGAGNSMPMLAARAGHDAVFAFLVRHCLKLAPDCYDEILSFRARDGHSLDSLVGSFPSELRGFFFYPPRHPASCVSR